MNNQNLLLSGSLNAGVNASDWKVNEVIKGMWEITSGAFPGNYHNDFLVHDGLKMRIVQKR